MPLINCGINLILICQEIEAFLNRIVTTFGTTDTKRYVSDVLYQLKIMPNCYNS